MTVAKIVTFLGTRSEIIKLSPLVPLLAHAFEHRLVHSVQGEMREMESALLAELRLPTPDYQLEASSDTQGRQIANMMIELERILLDESPQALVVTGGTNTALAGGLVGNKLGIPIAHVGAGIRTFNSRAPEEINRILIDRMAMWLLAPDESARDHLLAEGLAGQKIDLVGSTTIDACRRNMQQMPADATTARLGLNPNEYIVVTLHRAENTVKGVVQEIVAAINALSHIWPIIFPAHRHTLQAINEAGAFDASVKVIEPPGYLDMLQLTRQARALLTDSSGLHEEAAVLGTPALILRHETEWPALIESGGSVLVGNTYRSLMDRAWPILASESGLRSMRRKAVAPPGGAALRIVRRLEHDLVTKGALTIGQPAANPLALKRLEASSLS